MHCVGRTVIVIIDKTASTEASVLELQEWCAADNGVEKVRLESDRKQWQLTLKVRSKGVYSRLRTDLSPVMRHNVVTVHAVIEGGPEDGNTFLGFVFLDESSKGAEEFEPALLELYRSLGLHQALRTDDRALAAVVIRDDEPKNLHTMVALALSSHSIEVAWREFLSPAKTLSQILGAMRLLRKKALR